MNDATRFALIVNDNFSGADLARVMNRPLALRPSGELYGPRIGDSCRYTPGDLLVMLDAHNGNTFPSSGWDGPALES